MTTEYNNEDDPYLRPYRPDLDDESDEDDESDDLVTDLDEAAAEFRMRYYGPDNNPQPPAAMVELAPEVMRLVDAVVYGEIYNRPAVDLKTRSLCTIAALVVLGHSPQMIKRHITGALHIGVTEEEISEIIAQMVFYGGMPAAVNAFRIAKETFDEQAGVTPAAPLPSPALVEVPLAVLRRRTGGRMSTITALMICPTKNLPSEFGPASAPARKRQEGQPRERLRRGGLGMNAAAPTGDQATGEKGMKIGFIGTGNMGNPMAANLIRAGHQLTVHDLRREAATNLLEMGADWADSPKEAVPGNDAVLTSLPVPRDVEAVVLGEGGILEGADSGSIIFDLSTNSPTVVRRLHEVCAEQGVTLLDSPVSGGTYGARREHWP